MIKRVTIIGLGLIGASLAHRIKTELPSVTVVGISRRTATVGSALRKKWIDSGSLRLSDSSGSDLVIVCTPIHLIIPTIHTLRPFLSPTTIVMDVGSTKAEVVRRAHRLLKGYANFIGGHPMAGSEKSGFDWADQRIFDHSNFILTPAPDTSSRSVRTASVFLRRLGFNVLKMPADRHDYLIGLISHLPYLAAVALVDVVARDKRRALLRRLAATGFQSTTRKAASPWQWGKDIAHQNHQLIRILHRYIRVLTEMEATIRKGNIPALGSRLKTIQQFRSSMF